MLMRRKSSHNHEITWSYEKTNRLWDFYSKNLPQNQYFSFHSGKYVLDYVERNVKFSNMRSVLDFGCGPGYLLERLINICNGKVYGLDSSRGAVDEVNKKFTNNPTFGKASCIDKLPSSFKDNSMDLIISVEVVEHLDDDQLVAMLLEIRRLLKREGYVVITTPNSEDIETNKVICPECGCVFHRWQHVRSWNALSLRAYFEKNGFETFHVAETFFRPRESLPGRLVRQAIDRLRCLRSHSAAPPKPHLIYIGTK